MMPYVSPVHVIDVATGEERWVGMAELVAISRAQQMSDDQLRVELADWQRSPLVGVQWVRLYEAELRRRGLEP